jgi:hypothetical protein
LDGSRTPLNELLSLEDGLRSHCAKSRKLIAESLELLAELREIVPGLRELL